MTEHRKCYIASSWKNADTVKTLAQFLRQYEMEVYAFCEPEGRPDDLDNFVFGAEQWDGPLPMDQTDWITFTKNHLTERAFKADKAGLDWANTVILLLPCGKSAHMEAGYAVGQGKELYIYGNLPIGERDTMYLFANGLFKPEELPVLLKRLKGVSPI
jgi:hypothetical protein